MTGLLLASVAASALSTGGGGGPTGDPHFANVTLLLGFEGPNNSTTLTNEGSVTTTFGFQSNAVISTVDFKFGGSSLALNIGADTNDYLLVNEAAVAEFLLDPWTAECWFKNTVAPSSDEQLIFGNYGATRVGTWCFVYTTGGEIEFWYTQSGFVKGIINLGSPAAGWNHLAVCRDGDNLTGFVNGAVRGSATGVSALSMYHSSNRVQVGNAVGSEQWRGYVDEVRLTKGVARYSAAFTPPTAAFPRST